MNSFNPAARHTSDNSPWTPERDDILRKMWGEKTRCRLIAEHLTKLTGISFSKNSIIARGNRLKLERRKPTGGRAPGEFWKKVSSRPSPANEKIIPQEQRKTFWQLSPRDCRWPVGEVGSRDFFFCGGSSEEGHPYCLDHCIKAYNHEYRKRRAAIEGIQVAGVQDIAGQPGISTLALHRVGAKGLDRIGSNSQVDEQVEGGTDSTADMQIR